MLDGTSDKAQVAIGEYGHVYPQWDGSGFNESGQAWNAIMNRGPANLELEGLHCHIGTYMLTASAYAVAARKMCELAQATAEKAGIRIKYLDMGGGFCSSNTLKGSYLQGADVIPNFDDYADAIVNTILNFGFKPEELPLLILETGR